MTNAELDLIAERAKAFVRNQVAGGCRIPSLGKHCPCPLCAIDALAEEARTARAIVAAVEDAVRDTCCPPENHEGNEDLGVRYVALNEDGDPIIEADSLADVVRGMGECWESEHERANEAEREIDAVIEWAWENPPGGDLVEYLQRAERALRERRIASNVQPDVQPGSGEKQHGPAVGSDRGAVS